MINEEGIWQSLIGKSGTLVLLWHKQNPPPQPPLPPPFSWPQVMLNTLTFRSDWRLISTNNITLESHIKVVRIKEMITTKEAPDC